MIGLTVNVNDVETDSLPSVTETSTKIEPLKSASGVTVKLEPSTVTTPLLAVAEKVKTSSTSTSLAKRSIVIDSS